MATLLTQTTHQQQQFGGSAGGPIKKDKLFYFFTYDGFRKVNPILYTSSTSAATVLLCDIDSERELSVSLTQSQCLAAAQYTNQIGSFPRASSSRTFFPKLTIR